MVKYLVNILSILLFAFFVIYNYYTTGNGMHIESFSGYIGYILLVGIVYTVYKTIQYQNNKYEVSFSLFGILNYFLGHLLILCILFFHYNNELLSSGFILFFKILGFSFFPILLVLISIGFGKKILLLVEEKVDDISHFKELSKNSIFTFLTSLGIGFFSFVFLLDLIGILGFYNLYVVFSILIIFLALSYKEFITIINGIFSYRISFDLKKGSYFNLLTAEFFFLISTLVLSVSLIFIVRPFPIGWDDLGVYMNYPHLLAESGKIISLGSMFSWQTFTGIGYMFGSTTQAFFLNIVGGFLSIISLILITSDLLKTKDKKNTFINIPLLVGTIFISMPMIVFQQAKDMKLDAGLFFISIISIYILYKYIITTEKSKNILGKITDKILHHNNFDHGNIIILLIIGLLAGFAFSIKLTSLLLISSIIGLISYFRLGIFGFLAYISLFFGIFTKANLWGLMNVVVNPDKIPGFETKIFIISILIGIALFIYSISKNKNYLKKYLTEVGVFILGIFIALSPWIGKNIYDSYPNISVSKLILGTSEANNFDLTKIYNSTELEKIENNIKIINSNFSGSTNNEDFGRYIGYEKGINNFMKSPWNLSMQKNQAGEFTDIGFIYLLFIPLILLFLPFKNKYYSIGIFVLFGIELFVFFFEPFTNLMSLLNLPLGYIFIFLSFLIPTVYFLLTLKNTEENYIFKLNIVFASFYIFLWTISSFLIVWYGIVMYFNMLIMIAIGFYYLSSFDEKESKDNIIKLFGSIIMFILVLVYILYSVLPHSFNNLKNASYTEYKLGQINTNEAPFLYHPEYLNFLFELNIIDNKKAEFILKNINNENIINILKNNNSLNNISNIFYILRQIQVDANAPIELKMQAKNSLDRIFKGILNPINEYKNKENIYRLGTFLMYFISENNKRILEDSLIFTFNNYIYDENIDITVQRLKDIGAKYLLVDLNAATIDRDNENHNLTNRYEKLLKTFISDKLELIETDSVCLKLALNDYFNYKDFSRYMTLAGVNYESYDENNKIINRGTKAQVCYEYILELRKNNLINQNQFQYLNDINATIETNSGVLDTDEKVIKYLHSQLGSSKKVLFKIK